MRIAVLDPDELVQSEARRALREGAKRCSVEPTDMLRVPSRLRAASSFEHPRDAKRIRRRDHEPTPRLEHARGFAYEILRTADVLDDLARYDRVEDARREREPHGVSGDETCARNASTLHLFKTDDGHIHPDDFVGGREKTRVEPLVDADPFRIVDAPEMQSPSPYARDRLVDPPVDAAHGA